MMFMCLSTVSFIGHWFILTASREEYWNLVTLCWIRCLMLFWLLSLRSYITKNKICLNYKQYFFGLFHWSAAILLCCCILLIMLNCFFGLKAKLKETHKLLPTIAMATWVKFDLSLVTRGLYKIHTTESLLFATNVRLTLWRKKAGLP